MIGSTHFIGVDESIRRGDEGIQVGQSMRLHGEDPVRGGAPDEIVCRPAETRADYAEAFRLTYRQYISAGLAVPNSAGYRIAAHQLEPFCAVILAEAAGTVVGTVSLAWGESLPMERLFPRPVAALREAGERIVEVGCLASREESASFPSPVYVALTRATIHWARLGGFGRMIAAVHPRHGRFYRRAMGFRWLGGEASYDLVNHNRAVCVCGDPNDANVYREPWRTHFFSGPWTGNADFGRGLDPADRSHFERLMPVTSQTVQSESRRVA